MIEMQIGGIPVDPHVYRDVEEIPAMVTLSVAEDGSETMSWQRDPDVVKVIRCIDCQHCDRFWPGVYWCGALGHEVGLEDYCSKGEEWEDERR